MTDESSDATLPSVERGERGEDTPLADSNADRSLTHPEPSEQRFRSRRSGNDVKAGPLARGAGPVAGSAGLSASTPARGFAAGALMFARFAYPPNALGLCGPADSLELLDQGSAGVAQGSTRLEHRTARQEERGLRELAQGFEGAWPYLQLIAAANGLKDPLDPRVVEAYWVGNDLLGNVPIAMLGNSMDERFRRRAARQWDALVEVLEVGARPHHNFHVFSVYPWVGLLNSGAADEPLRVLDQCRIRWGQVQDVFGSAAMVKSQGLDWVDGALILSEPRVETVIWQQDGRAFVPAPKRGNWVAMHWGWLCQSLDARQLQALRRESALQLEIANDRVARSGPAAVLDG